MKTGTGATRAAARQAWRPVLNEAGAQGQELGEQILALAHTIAVARLSGPLTDPGRSSEDKATLATSLFSGKADERVVELLAGMVRGRWSQTVDLISALHDLGIESTLAGSVSSGGISQVEQELFEVSETLQDNPELLRSLEPSRWVSTDDRVTLAARLFGDKISQPAMSLLTWSVRHYSQGGILYNLRRVTELAAEVQGRVIADVVTATPMTHAQEDRLAAILRYRLGTEVELNTMVDPAVLGGVKVTVRDLVIDASAQASLAEVRSALAG